MVTKSLISPQRKHGSLRNLKHVRAVNSRTQDKKACARDYGSYTRVHAQIFTKINSYLMSLSLKFRKDPSFRSGDISLFVTVYDLELRIL